jgi:AcrR family transcriptional regulator
MHIMTFREGLNMAKTMATNRQKQAMNTRNKIFKAATSLMHKQGIQQTTVEAICAKAHVSVGSFYHYFKSKDEILHAVYASADQYFKDVVEPEIAPLGNLEKLLGFFRHYARYNGQTGLDFTTHLYFNSENKFFIEHNRYMHTLLRGILEEIHGVQGLQPGLPLRALEEFLFLVARGIVSDWCLRDGQFDLEEKTVLYFEVLLTCVVKE